MGLFQHSLRELRFSRETIEAVLAAATASDSPEVATTHNVRRTLEMLFRDAADIAQRLKGVSFRGDRTSFGELRQFVRSMEWMTETESGFVNGYYKLLSDGEIHPGQSVIYPAISVQILLYVADLVSSRVATPLKRRAHLAVHDSAYRNRIVMRFLQGLRQRRYSSDSFRVEFDADLMNLTRDRLRADDAEFLLDVITADDAQPGLRNRCVSLLLSSRVAPNGPTRARIVEQLDQYYWQLAPTGPWQVSRAIALALANRVNNPTCILDFVDRIAHDSTLSEANLATTDAYYGDQSAALNYYIGRLNDLRIPTDGCVWEAYYVCHRSPNRKATEKILKRRLQLIEQPALSTFWQRMIQSVTDERTKVA